MGLYRYKRMNFGISSASEIFQEKIRNVISGIEGARNISDDIICFGAGPNAQRDHDAALEATLTRLRDHSLTVNWDKCEFNTHTL